MTDSNIKAYNEIKLDQELGPEEAALPSYFKEHAIAIRNLKKLVEFKSFEENKRAIDKLDEIIRLFEMYQSQPSLLDPYLKEMVDIISFKLRPSIHELNFLPSKIQDLSGCSQTFIIHDRMFLFLYHLTRIRGYKTIINLFSHEVSDLEPIFYYFITRKQNQGFPWQSEYILLLWLSMICMMPFDLSKVDSGFSKQIGFETLTLHIISISKQLLSSNGKCAEGAGRLLAQVLVRQDCIKEYLPNFLYWASDTLKSKNNIYLWIGILHTLVYIVKLGPREELISFLQTFEFCLEPFNQEIGWRKNANLRKLRIKFSQQLGLLCLKPRIASWRYKRGSRTLGESFQNSDQISNNNDNYAIPEEDEFEVPEIIESILDTLFEGLKDKEVACRWSSAKGIGRVAQRLPKSFGEDISRYLLDQFQEDVVGYDTENPIFSNVDDGNWHGLCLAIAELVRRGLLPKDFVGESIRAVLFALKLDIRKGSHSVGSNVRDAACYVFWSFSRAYPKEDFIPFSDQLSREMVMAAVLDRESNVRRASSAAFQEFVGRVHLFPDGIEIMSLIDYFSVANLKNSFLKVSLKVAKFPHYRAALYERMYTTNSLHWDINVRRLTGETIQKVVPMMTEEDILKSIIYLLPQTKKSDIGTVHGSLLALGHICATLTLRLTSKQQFNSLLFPNINNNLSFNHITNVLLHFTTHGLPNLGSDIILEAIFEMINNLSSAQWPIDDNLRNVMKELIDLGSKRKEERLQRLAAEAMLEFSKSYKIYATELDKYLEALDNEDSMVSKRGIILLLGKIDVESLSDKIESVILKLVQKVREQGLNQSLDVHIKMNCIIGIKEIITRQLSSNNISTELYLEAFNCLLSGLEDYTVTSQGDVGSHVRKEAMIGLKVIVQAAINSFSNSKNDNECFTLLTEKDLGNLVKSLLKQSCEKIDRIRQCSGEILLKLLKQEELMIPYKKEVIETLNTDPPINWLNPSSVFPNIVKLLKIPIYRKSVLSGIILSSGALSESLIKYAGSSLMQFLTMISSQEYSSTFNDIKTDGNANELEYIINDILELFKENPQNDKMILPLLEVLNLMFEEQVFNCFLIKEDDTLIYKLAQSIIEIYKDSKQLLKLLACSKVLCYICMAKNPKAKKLAWGQVLRFLTFGNLKVRTTTCDQLYLVISSQVEMDINEDDMEDEESNDLNWLEMILLDTDWSMPIPELRKIIFPIYPKFGLLPPKLVKKQ